MKEFLKKKNLPIIIILLISTVLHLLVLVEYGPRYGLESDDLSYVNAAIHFAKTGEITMHGVISAQIMPGMLFMLAPFVWLFGEGKLLWISIKLFYLVLGLFSIVGVYKIVKQYTNEYFGAIATLFFLTIDYVWMNNLVLTETPYMCFFIWLIYASLQLGNTHEKKYFYLIVLFYMMTLLIRPNIAPYPLFLFIYLYFRKYDMKQMVRQMFIAGGIVLCFIVPWSIRNYMRFDRFIPLTYGMGNPLLLGTYQGVNYPSDAELDYETNVIQKMPKEMKYYYNDGKWKNHYLSKYYSLELDGMKAKYRMQEWWKKDKVSMLKSYLVYKPKVLMYGSFYWNEVLGISVTTCLLSRKIDLLLFLVFSLFLLFHKERRKEMLFITSFYAFQILVYAYSFAFNRYGQTMYFMRYIIIGIGLYEMYQWVQKKICSKRIINDV